ncbi:uncharacterized protein LOC111400264 [Olea europaea var. sylvestris]|uniref:uncharacterized protein LOC111400264 n=1 Tax=Olea europaea var. sylvestris TaxID=158386 RepID=UPI000C1D2EE4|nr:uncharacterized protein LOC111400264 [Olea europaea var. sylvestris]
MQISDERTWSFKLEIKVESVVYRLALPPELSAVHKVFHISMIKKYMHDPDHVVNYQFLDVRKGFSYEELPIRILDRRVHKLRNTEIQLVKVQWNNHGVEEVTWEEEEVKDKNPTLFANA